MPSSGRQGGSIPASARVFGTRSTRTIWRSDAEMIWKRAPFTLGAACFAWVGHRFGADHALLDPLIKRVTTSSELRSTETTKSARTRVRGSWRERLSADYFSSWWPIVAETNRSRAVNDPGHGVGRRAIDQLGISEKAPFSLCPPTVSRSHVVGIPCGDLYLVTAHTGILQNRANLSRRDDRDRDTAVKLRLVPIEL